MKLGDLKEEQGEMKKTYENMLDAEGGMFERVMETRSELYEQMSNANRTAFQARTVEPIGHDGIDIAKFIVRGAIS